jgi:phosphoglycolate phosphatase
VLVSGVLGVSDPEIVEKNHAMLVRYYNENPGTKTNLYPGAIETLIELQRRGIRNAVASNKPDPVTQQVVTLMGIRHLIPDAIGETPGIPRKPAPHMLQHLMQRASVTPAETLMVGDTDVDINFARAAGVAIVSVTYGQYDGDYLEALKPDAIISSLNELPSLIASA